MIDLLFIFTLYSIFGWLLEIIYFYIKTKKYQKRGILGGPYCPLYGFSITTTAMLTNSFSDNTILVFIFGAVICTFYELIAGLLIEKTLNTKMWDYSDRRYNLKGYICLKFSLIWGLLTTLSVKVINPVLLHVNDVQTQSVKLFFGFTVIILMIINILTSVSYLIKH